MAARDGMVDMIAKLREYTSTAVGDTTVNSVSYWTDDQLQDYLDNESQDLLDVLLSPFPLMVSGSLEYTKYYIPTYVPEWIEEDTAFVIVDSEGTTVSSSLYTYTREKRLVEFSTDTEGTTYYLRGVGYDINAAASAIWMVKAGFRSNLVEWKAGDFSVKEDKEYNHCIERANFFAAGGVSGSSINSVRLVQVGWKT